VGGWGSEDGNHDIESKFLAREISSIFCETTSGSVVVRYASITLAPDPPPWLKLRYKYAETLTWRLARDKLCVFPTKVPEPFILLEVAISPA